MKYTVSFFIVAILGLFLMSQAAMAASIYSQTTTSGNKSHSGYSYDQNRQMEQQYGADQLDSGISPYYGTDQNFQSRSRMNQRSGSRNTMNEDMMGPFGNSPGSSATTGVAGGF